MKKKYQTKAFKVLVKREVKDKAFNELDAIKAEQKYINLTSFMNQQMYLVSDQQDNKAKTDIFNLRTDNFLKMFDNNNCPWVEKIQTVKFSPCHPR